MISGTSSQLLIDTATKQCRNARNFNPFEDDTRSSDLQLYEAYGFLGLVSIDNQAYAALVTQVKVAARLRGHVFFQVIKTAFVPLGRQEVTAEAKKVIESTAKVLESGFYASPTFDISQSIQRQYEGAPAQGDKYFWNQALYRDLVLQGAHAKWFMPVVQGFIGAQRMTVDQDVVDYLLISRRCNGRAGTRYYARGVDDDGEVANFVETEQILYVNDSTLSLVLVRGTVPVFWQQTGLTARFELTRSKELTSPAFSKNLTNLLNLYEKVTFVNLLSSKKPHERVLSEAFRTQIHLTGSAFEDSIQYIEYDYKRETKGNLANVSELVKQVSPYLLLHLFFSVTGEGTIQSRQKGVTRVNCLDCLDRTNIVMSRFAWYMFTWQMRSLGKTINVDFDDMNSEIVSSFKALWVENGDALSWQYSGAGSSLAASIKTGKSGIRTFIERSMTGIERLYSAAYDDAKKQDGIETLLGKNSKMQIGNAQTEMVMRQIKQRETEFLDYETVEVRVCIWNVRGERPPSSDTLSPFLFESAHSPHLIAIGLQDLILVNPTNVFKSTKHLGLISAWNNVIAVTFARYRERKYLLLKMEVQVGLMSVVYVRSDLAPFVTNLDVDTVKLGLDTTFGGKGAIIIRLSLHSTSLCFCHVHLIGDQSDTPARLQQLETIETQAFQVEEVGRRKRHPIPSHDAIFLYGDLNFKIDSTAGRIHHYCKTNSLSMLLANEQLTSVMLEKKSPSLQKYREGEITFLPTVNREEVTKENPDMTLLQSWTDRILYAGKNLKQTSYAPIDLRLSSHLPIASTFSLTVSKVNEARKYQVERETASKCFPPQG